MDPRLESVRKKPPGKDDTTYKNSNLTETQHHKPPTAEREKKRLEEPKSINGRRDHLESAEVVGERNKKIPKPIHQSMIPNRRKRSLALAIFLHCEIGGGGEGTKRFLTTVAYTHRCITVTPYHSGQPLKPRPPAKAGKKRGRAKARSIPEKNSPLKDQSEEPIPTPKKSPRVRADRPSRR